MVHTPALVFPAVAWALPALVALASLAPGNGLRHGLRLSSSGPSSDTGTASKPKLRLAFEAEVSLTRELNGDGVKEQSIESHHIVVDEGRLAISVEPKPPPGHQGPRGSMMVDVRNDVRIDSEPFFDEVICFAFDLNAGPSKRRAVAFAASLGGVLGVPLQLYKAVNHADGQLKMSNGSCKVWAASFGKVMALPPPAAFEAILTSTGLDTQQGLSRELLDAAGVGGHRLAIRHSVRFCVDAAGQLLAANASSSLEVVGPNGTALRVLRTEATHAVLSQVQALEKNATVFSPEQHAAGGRCVDLTTASAPDDLELQRGLNDGERLARINREARGTWKAAPYHHWQDTSVQDVVGSLGTGIRPLQLPLQRMCPDGSVRPSCHAVVGIADTVAAPPPQRFDARKHWRACRSIRRVRNQGKCGSCWAVAAAGVLSDRLCIAAARAHSTNSSLGNVVLSPQYMLDCDSENGGCGGGHLDDAWKFLMTRGIPEETCDPYAYCPRPSDPQCGLDENDAQAAAQEALQRPHACPKFCTRSGLWKGTVFRARSAYAVGAPGDVLAMQQEILANGPLEAAFFVFSDFHNYHRGTYFRTKSAVGPLGGHAVRLIGWGVDRHDTDYWQAANSFGRKWGMRGFFRIRRGTNECGIETMPAAGLPLLPGVKEAAA